MDEVFAIKQVRIRKTPVNGATIVYAPTRSVLRLTGKREMHRTRTESGGYTDAPWVEVEYKNYTGWTYEFWLERVAEPRPVDPLLEVVPIPDEMRTPNPNDAQQYLRINGKDLHNLCPHFCAAFAGGDPINVLLDKAKADSYPAWEAGVVRNVGLGISALEKLMRDVYKFDTFRFAEPLHDEIVGTLVSPGTIGGMLDSGWLLIAGVKINGTTGKLISSGKIGHWVVLTDVQPFGVDDGQVKIYNPFPNQYETYPYRDFMASMGGWNSLTGLWVPADFYFMEKGASKEAGFLSGFYDSRFEELDDFMYSAGDWIASNIEWITKKKAWLDERKDESEE